MSIMACIDFILFLHLSLRMLPLIVRGERHNRNIPRLNNMNAVLPIHNQFRHNENYDQLPQLSQESHRPVLGRLYFEGRPNNNREEQKESIDQNSDLRRRYSRRLPRPLLNHRDNGRIRQQQNPVPENIPQPRDGEEANPRGSTGNNNRMYKIVSHSECNENECTICLDGLGELDQEVVKVGCEGNHAFHRACIDDWLRRNRT